MTRSTRSRPAIRFGLLGLVLWVAGGAAAARAEISFVDLFRSNTFVQTGDGPALTPTGLFFSARLTSTGPGDFDAVQMTYPGPGSPVALTPISPTLAIFQAGLYPDQAALDAAFPTGTYAFAASGPGGADATSLVYAGDNYPQSLPYLAGTDYSALQGLDPNAPFAVDFSPFVTGGQADASFIFFTIFDTAANAFVFNAGFLPATATGVVIPAGQLMPGRSYLYELIFSNRDIVPSPGAVFDAQLGFDLRTTGSFTTAVPEPASLALLAPAGVGLGGLALRRRAGARRPARPAVAR